MSSQNSHANCTKPKILILIFFLLFWWFVRKIVPVMYFGGHSGRSWGWMIILPISIGIIHQIRWWIHHFDFFSFYLAILLFVFSHFTKNSRILMRFSQNFTYFKSQNRWLFHIRLKYFSRFGSSWRFTESRLVNPFDTWK